MNFAFQAILTTAATTLCFCFDEKKNDTPTITLYSSNCSQDRAERVGELDGNELVLRLIASITEEDDKEIGILLTGENSAWKLGISRCRMSN